MAERTPILSVTIKDCEVQTFSSGGPGGQHQNRTASGVRVIHRVSGALGEARDSRHQFQNKKAAFVRMAQSPRFQTWVRARAGETVAQKPVSVVVDEMMNPDNIKVEVKAPTGEWVRE